MADPPPVPAASSPVSPPITKVQIVDLKTGLATLLFVSFLTELWAAVAGEGGLGPTINTLVQEVDTLMGQVATLMGQVEVLIAKVATIFDMHGDGTLSDDGELTVTSTEGVPFAPSATIDTTNADNITSGTLDTDRLPIVLLHSFALVDLPAPEAGSEVLCTDLGGGPGMLVGNGAEWVRTSPGLETQAPAATLTLQVLANAEEQLQTAALAAGMVVTLAAADAYPGARFRWIRAGAGAFTLVFKDGGSGTTLYTSPISVTETAEFVYSGTTWALAQHSAL